MPHFVISYRSKFTGERDTFHTTADNAEDAESEFNSELPNCQMLACRELGATKRVANHTEVKSAYVPTRILRARYEAKLAPDTIKSTDAPRSVAVTSLVTGETYDCALASTEDHPC